MYIKNLLALATLTCLSGVALADDVKVPEATAGDSSQQTATVSVPARGSTMGKVESKFGSPTQRVAAVGKPPISRWEYPNFIVYFEGERVIHSVLR